MGDKNGNEIERRDEHGIGHVKMEMKREAIFIRDEKSSHDDLRSYPQLPKMKLEP